MWQRQTTMAPRRRRRGREPGGLRVVQHHDVAAPDQRRQLVGVVAQHALVDAALAGAERPAVALVAVQVVVDAAW